MGAYISFLTAQEGIDFIFVNDASTDSTQDLLNDLKTQFPGRVEILHHQVRSGKAEAIRTGMLSGLRSGLYQYFGFIDADLAVPLHDIPVFVAALAAGQRSMAFGIRADENKRNISRTPARNIMGHLFRAYLHHVLRFPIADSQCGAKVFAAAVIPVLYTSPFGTHWLSDVELMIRYCDHFQVSREDIVRHLIQIPVSKFEDKANSKVNAFELLRTLTELAAISASR